jgi:hypothetical protein
VYFSPEILAKVGFSIEISESRFSSSSIKFYISYSKVSFNLTLIFYG